MHELTVPQIEALDAARDIPARLIDPTTKQTHILLKSDDFAWMRDLLGDEPDAPRLSDPRTQTTYALLPEERYERFKAFFEEDPLTPSERSALLREAGNRAGWDNLQEDESERQEAS